MKFAFLLCKMQIHLQTFKSNDSFLPAKPPREYTEEIFFSFCNNPEDLLNLWFWIPGDPLFLSLPSIFCLFWSYSPPSGISQLSFWAGFLWPNENLEYSLATNGWPNCCYTLFTLKWSSTGSQSVERATMIRSLTVLDNKRKSKEQERLNCHW